MLFLKSPYPLRQPNELGVGCIYMRYISPGNIENGFGDIPCKSYKIDTCYTAHLASRGIYTPVPCAMPSFCLIPAEKI
jgi:hypothetical protein